MTGPLTGIRVLDLGTVVAGPFAATLLGDFGAEVIKVELPGVGDPLRRLGPTNDAGQSYWFAADGRNKQSITLDLRVPAGKELLLRLVERSDVLVENFVPGTLAGWGLTPEVLLARNPRLILSHASGFGQTGPLANRPGYDRIGFAFAGQWNISGEPGREPMKPGAALTDYMTGIYGALGIMLALYHRDANGGPGQEVDAALYESAFRAMEYTAVHYAATGTIRERMGNSAAAVPTGAFQSKDGTWLAIAVAQDAMYRRIMLAIGRPDFANHPVYSDMRGRLADREPVEDALRAWIAERTAAEVMETFLAAEIPVGATRTIAEIFADEHVAAREMLVEVDDPAIGLVKMQGVTPKLSLTPGAIARPSPTLGQHNAAVYGELLGLGEEEIARLTAEGVI